MCIRDSPEAGNFKQRVILSHVGFDRPTVLVTEGYAAHYATHPRYQEDDRKVKELFRTKKQIFGH